MASSWIRLKMEAGVVFGLVEVPSRCPGWFLAEAEKAVDAHHRISSPTELLKEMSIEEWVDILYSHRQPILLQKPLAPEQQEEFVLFPPGKWEAMQGQYTKIREQTNDEAANAWRRTVDDRMKEFGVLLLEQRDKVPPQEADDWNMVPMSQAFGIKGRVFMTYNPLIDIRNVDRDINPETRLAWEEGTIWNFVTDSTRWDQMGDGHYGAHVEAATGLHIPPPQVPTQP